MVGRILLKHCIRGWKLTKETLHQLRVAIFDVRCTDEACDIHFVKSKPTVPLEREKKLSV